MDKRSSVSRNIQQAVLEALVREPVRIHRVHYADAVDHELVRIDIRGCRAQSNSPDTVLPLYHLMGAGKLDIYRDLLRIVIAIIESYSVVRIDYRRFYNLKSSRLRS